MLDHLRRLAWIALFACFVTAFALEALDASKHPTQQAPATAKPKNNQETKDNNFASDYVALIFAVGRFADLHSGGISAIASGLLTIVTIGLVWIGVRQEFMGRTELRAYIGITTIDMVNVAPLPTAIAGQTLQPTIATALNPTVGPACVIIIKNSGQTPAKDVVHWGAIYLREYPLTSRLPAKILTGMISKTSLGPGHGASKTVAIPHPLTPKEIADLRTGKSAIYVYGDIRYRDVWNNDRFVVYSYFHNFMAGNVGVSATLLSTPEGNDAN